MRIKQKSKTEMIATLKKLGAWKCKYDLRSADLRYADLSNADLRSADLSNADLRSADLRSANLSNANLRSADLRSADLRYANLSNANLSNANLWTFQTSQYRAIFLPHQRIMKIGCLEFGIDDWVRNYLKIGHQNDFTELEIKQYGMFIKMCAGVLE